jgi:hypothetical protein
MGRVSFLGSAPWVTPGRASWILPAAAQSTTGHSSLLILNRMMVELTNTMSARHLLVKARIAELSTAVELRWHHELGEMVSCESCLANHTFRSGSKREK